MYPLAALPLPCTPQPSDAEKDVEKNKDSMKDNSVQSLSYPHLTTPKLPTSVTLPISNLAELTKNVRLSSSYYSLYLSFSLSLSGGGWANMNLVKHNLVQRGLEEYMSGLLSLLGKIMSRGKGYTSRGGGNKYHHGIRRSYQAESGGNSTTFTTWKIGGNN